jgi:hypothetical protein
MKKREILLFIGCCVIIIFTNCTNDKGDVIYPAPSCDTSFISLDSNLTPIMEANCFRCHDAENAHTKGADYNLEDFSTLQNAVLSGELISAIKHDDPSIPYMPFDGGKLSDCEINMFIKWKHEGAPDN